MSVRKSKAEIATIDCCLVTIAIPGSGSTVDEFGFDTANQVEVEVQTEVQEPVRLIIKGILRAQKKQKTTVVGNRITLHDNVFNPDLVIALQGGEIEYDSTETTKIVGYTPPAADDNFVPTPFVLNVYSAQYNAAGTIVQYEKISYPNCTGDPVAFNSEDNVFRTPQYIIDSAPEDDEPPYEISYVSSLPVLS